MIPCEFLLFHLKKKQHCTTLTSETKSINQGAERMNTASNFIFILIKLVLVIHDRLVDFYGVNQSVNASKEYGLMTIISPTTTTTTTTTYYYYYNHFPSIDYLSYTTVKN